MEGGHVAAVEDVSREETVLFRVRERESGEVREAIAIGTDEGVTAWLNHCQHFRDVPLDKGSGAVTRNGEIVCTNHGAMFESDTGRCTYGPCEGAYLDSVDVTVRDGWIHLDDPDYEFVGPGPIETDDDLSSDSNLEF